ncbi:MAG: PD40 domain-containing protein [Saprospiraceae bacterium]|nr:PD40 domain-containing protein [Saprospiraceae bacterium]
MKYRIPNKFKLTLLLILSFAISQSQQQIDKTQAFLPELFSKYPNVRDLAISEKENEMFFTIQSYLGELSIILYSKIIDGKWSKPRVASFSGQFQDLEPFLSPDGFKLYFASNRPISDTAQESKDYDIWYVERKDFRSKWSIPINVGPPVNTKDNEFYPSVSRLNNLYFTCDGGNSKGKDDIFVSKFINGQYLQPISMSDSINTDGYEFNGFIAADESYLIYTCYNKTGGYGSGDLYISFNKGNEQWTTSKNIGKNLTPPKWIIVPLCIQNQVNYILQVKELL